MNDEIFIEFTDNYLVSNYGRIQNKITGKFRKPQIRGSYPSVLIRNKNYSIHRLVAFYFVNNPNPEKYDQVNHIDNNPFNFKYDNLEWCDMKLNHQHALKQGRHTSQTCQKFKNQQNEKLKPSKVKVVGKSGIKGITVVKNKKGVSYRVFFNSSIYGSKYLGTFENLDEAKNVYRKAHIERFGIDPYETDSTTSFI